MMETQIDMELGSAYGEYYANLREEYETEMKKEEEWFERQLKADGDRKAKNKGGEIYG